MENTLEMKQFFAQYWGQEAIIKFPHEDEHKFKINSSNFDYVEYLELTPLEQISDEDALWLAKNVLIEDYIKNNPKEKVINYVKTHHLCITSLKQESYFRGHGYAIPYFDIYGNLIPIDEQINRGWVKLKKSPSN